MNLPILKNSFTDDIMRDRFWDPFDVFDLRTNRRISDSFFTFSYEGEDLIVSCDLPGIKTEDVHLEIEGNQLIVNATRTGRIEKKYSASARLPKGYDWENVEAILEHGVLNVRIKKKESEAKKKIEIKMMK